MRSAAEVLAAFPPGCVVELTSGMSKGLRGRVVGEARSMYLGVPDVLVQFELGMERPIRPDYLRRIDVGPQHVGGAE